MSRHLLILLFAGALTRSVLAQPEPSASSPWSPDKALLSRLGTPTNVEGFELRPPKGYTFRRMQGSKGMHLFAWVSAPRKEEEGVRGYVIMGVVSLPAKEKRHAPEEMLDAFLESIQRSRLGDWKRTHTEHGTINGLPFVRARWSGTAREAPFKMSGFNYVCLVGSQLIQLSSQDVESHPEALKLAETSVLTFKKIKTRTTTGQ